MGLLKYIPQYTVADYQQWEGDWELVDSHPVAMSPSPVRRHQRVAALMVSHLIQAISNLDLACSDCEVVYELDWIVNNHTVLRPDIAVICEPTGDFITTAPVLIIEVLCPSTAMRDKHLKYELYQGQGVKYYMLVDPDTHIVQAYQLIAGEYAPYLGHSYLLHDACQISLDAEAVVAAAKS